VSLTIHPSTSGKNDVESLKQSLSLQDINGKISAINASQIELIGYKIAEGVANNLGPVSKARIAAHIMQKTGQKSNSDLRWTMIIGNMAMKSGNTKFLSDTDFVKFCSAAESSIKPTITDLFSKPDSFFESGIVFDISDSDCEPRGFLSIIAQKNSIDLTSIDIPSEYAIYLKLNKDLTLEKSELVFVITQTSEDVEFSRTIFTIEELEQQFQRS
jgi:hypothetical protein